MKQIQRCGVFLLLLCAAGCTDKQTATQDEIETRVRDILSIPTFEHVYRDVVYVGEEKRFIGIPTKNMEALFSIDVKVRAGIDLTEGLEVDFRDSHTAVVSMPPAKVLSIDADENTIHQYFVREWGGNFSTLQYYDEINRKKEFIREDTISRGILIKAEENAAQLIRNFFRLAGFDTVEIRKVRPALQPEAEEEVGNG